MIEVLLSRPSRAMKTVAKHIQSASQAKVLIQPMGEECERAGLANPLKRLLMGF